MKRSGLTKFPSSVQLFKFCQRVLVDQKGDKIRDQEVGSILNYNPSDCSHWKRGEKSVRSVFALAKLAETLGLEPSLLHDIATGALNLEEAYFEYQESRAFGDIFALMRSADPQKIAGVRARVENFVERIRSECEFTTPPLYLPELLRSFSFISTQAVEMIDKLSRVLKVKPGHFAIQYKKGDLKAQTRMSMVKDLARIVFEGERSRFPELGPLDPEVVQFEEMIFTASLLIPKHMLLNEITRLDTRKNVVADIAALFWAPKTLVGFQLHDILRDENGRSLPRAMTANAQNQAAAQASF
jgi:hypothetical protein